LIGRGHEVFHSTTADINIIGANRVDWRQVEPDSYDAVIFVCGPILKSHPETQAFFDKFSDTEFVGIGVSLLPQKHPNYCNPFSTVFARQGELEKFGDVAVCASQSIDFTQKSDKVLTIGLVLRGEQHEYGTELCLWQEVSQIFDKLIKTLSRYVTLHVIKIENHRKRLANSC